ncbi:MAG: glycosyltransferase family 39 protein [Candidatus Brocadiia bacterium]
MKSLLDYIKNHQWAIILTLIILAIAVRLVIVWNTYVISSDGPVYISVAKDYYAGNYKAALSHPYHPLYPFLMSVAYHLRGSWEWAGLFISILFGALAIIPLWFMGKRIFPGIDGKASPLIFIGCLFYIFHPLAARYSAEVLTTGLFMSFLFFTAWMMLLSLSVDCERSAPWRFGAKWKYRYFFLTGVGAMMAYLVRPDGLILLFTAMALTVLIDIRRNYLKTSGKRALAVLILTLPWLLAATPYLYHMYKTQGRIEITQKFSLAKVKALLGSAELSDETPAPEKPGPNRYLNAVYIVAKESVKGVHVLLLLFLLVYIVSVVRKNPEPATDPKSSLIIWFTFGVYIIALLGFAVIFGRVSKRYTVPLGILLVFFSASGLDYLLAKMRLTNLRWLGITLTLLILSVHTFAPVSKDKIGQKMVGFTIRNDFAGKHSGTTTQGKTEYPPRIITSINRVPYYARGYQIAPEGNLLETLKTADYLVTDKNIELAWPEVKSWSESVEYPDFKVSLVRKRSEFPFESYKVYCIIDKITGRHRNR